MRAAENCLYRNQGDGTFKDVAAELGIADLNQAGTGVSMGAVWGDYDNDGYEDLFCLQMGTTGAVSQRWRPPFHTRHRASWIACLGERQYGDLV